jgi:O-antigen ligase
MRYLTRAFSFALFAFPAFALSTPFGSGLVEALLLIIAIVGTRHYRQIWTDTMAESPALKRFVYFWVLALMLEIMILALHGVKGVDVHSPMLRLATLGALLLVVKQDVKPNYYWYGLIAGCYAVLAVGLFQRYHLQMPRATGFHNQIHYGNFSLAMGMMAVVALTQSREDSRLFRIALVIAAVCGIITSLLSGSRGGWIGLLLAWFPIYAISKDKRPVVLVGLGVAGLVMIAFAIPATGIQARLSAITTDLEAYRQGDVHTSIGIRLELFRASWQVFLEHPWIGVGRDFSPVLNEMRKTGIEIPPHYQLNDTHNEVLFSMVRGGILGLGQVLILYLSPVMYFSKMLASPAQRENKSVLAFAGAGLILVLLTIDFGLSVNVFTRHIGKAFYFVTICMLVAATEISVRRTREGNTKNSDEGAVIEAPYTKGVV